MSTFMFLFRELLGSIRAKTGFLLTLSGLFVFASLAAFAALLLVGGADAATRDPEYLAPEEVILHLSPRLSADAVNDLYVELWGRDDVRSIVFRFAEEVSPGSTGGRFFVRATSAAAAAGLIELAETMNGVTQVEAGEPIPAPVPVGLTPTMRIVLLVVLTACVAISLLLGRLGYRGLLASFLGEIRVMRLSGAPEKAIVLPVVSLGVLLGLLTGLLLVVGIFLAQYALGDGPAGAASVAFDGRALTVSLAGLVLGLLLGGLIGLLGASLLTSREFSPLGS